MKIYVRGQRVEVKKREEKGEGVVDKRRRRFRSGRSVVGLTGMCEQLQQAARGFCDEN
jgi:hypothetical protein